MARARRNWTHEEDALLRRLVNNALAQSRPLLWRELAKSIPGRSNKDCRRRWWNSLAEGTAKGPWSEDEDSKLIEAVRKHGTNWAQVARAVASRSSDQCSSHWTQVLDPDINYCDWTTDEDNHLLHTVLSHGTNWTTVAASHTTKRTTLALKNRYSTLRMRHENHSNGRRSSIESVPRKMTPTLNDSTAGSGTELSDRQGYPGNINKVIEEDDEDEDEDDDEGGDVDGEQYQNGNHHNETRVEDLSARDQRPDSFQQLTERAPYGRQNGIGLPSSTTWPGFLEQDGLLTPKTFPDGTPSFPLESWVNEPPDSASYQSPYLLSQHPASTGPSEGLFQAVQTPARTVINAPYETYGENVMNIIGLAPSDSLTPKQSAGSPSLRRHSTSVEGRQPQTPRTTATTPTTTQQSPTAYQVSINMTCTQPQLEAVMGTLTSAGTDLDFKIKPK